MMKKILRFLLIFFITLTTYCQNREMQLSFDNILGKENIETLNLLVSDFENNYLIENYPNVSIEKAYKLYLRDVKTGNYEKTRLCSKDSRKIFKESNLRQEIYYVPDSIWIKNGFIYEKIKFWNNVDTPYYAINELPIVKNDLNLSNEKIIEKRLNNLMDFRLFGNYMTALKSVDNKFIKEYVNDKEYVGNISHRILADIFLKNNLDFTDYLIKRLIIIEFAY